MTMKTEQAVQARTGRKSLRDFLYVVFGHKKKVLAFTTLLFGAVCVAVLMKPSTYRSEARLLVRVGRETVGLDPTATIGEITHINRSYEAEINSELEILKSREIAERVAGELGENMFLRASRGAPSQGPLHTVRSAVGVLTTSPTRLAIRLGFSPRLSERQKAVERVVQSVKVQARPNTSVIDLSCNAESPDLAKGILDKFVQAYLDKHIAVFCTANSQQFFERQVSQLHAKLVGAEEELRKLKDATGVSSLEEQRSTMVAMIGSMDKGIAETEAELATVNARIAEFQGMLPDIPETIVTEETTGFSDYGADLMRSKLYDLRLAQKDVEVKYKSDSRQLEMIRQQVDEGTAILENELAKANRTQVTTGMNNNHQQVQMILLTEQSNVSALERKLETMRAQAAAARAQMKTLNDVENKTSRLQREIALLTENHSRYFAKLEEARIDQALRGERFSNIGVLQAATMPAAPVGPPKALHLILGLLMAVSGGVGFAFVCDHLDHSIRTPEDVREKLQLSTLASIPHSRVHAVGPSLKASRWKVFAEALGMNASMRWDIPANVRRHYTDLREQLLPGLNGSSRGPVIIGITSCSRDEGVSTVAANLACSLSERGDGSTLLVDANSRHPYIHRVFRTRLSPGLIDVLAAGGEGDGSDTIVHRGANLNVLTAGNADSPVAKTVTPDDLIRFLHTVRQGHRFTVVDMPALDDEDGSAFRLAGSCDGVVLVIETQRLRWEVVASRARQLQQQKINILGVLLNKRRFPVPKWIYAAL